MAFVKPGTAIYGDIRRSTHQVVDDYRWIIGERLSRKPENSVSTHFLHAYIKTFVDPDTDLLMIVETEQEDFRHL